MLINIPIEPIPMRYSVDWAKWFIDYFHKNNINYVTIKGEELTDGIEQGRFLDCVGTNYYKSSQLMQIMHGIQTKVIGKGDVLFFHDLWFPGIEQIKYTCQALNLDIKIMGCLHAGAYDPHDFLYQSNMGNWAIHFEHMLFALTDKIFIATNFHKKLIIQSRSLDPNKIKVTGFPFYPKKYKIKGRLNQIVFPHRLNAEKNPDIFRFMSNLYAKDFPGWKWVTTEKAKTKDQYYKMLEESKIAISLSDQETWGIAMQESVIAGCLPLVPSKLSYSEMFMSQFKYNNLLSVRGRLLDMLDKWEHYEACRRDQAVKFERNGSEAIPNICNHLHGIEEGTIGSFH